MSDCSLCGAGLILLLKDILCRDLGKKVFYRELVQRSCHRDLLERSCKETTCRDLAMTEKEVSKEILPTGLLQISCQESSYEGLVQRSCQETSCKDVVQRPDLVKRAEILLRDL